MPPGEGEGRWHEGIELRAESGLEAWPLRAIPRLYVSVDELEPDVQSVVSRDELWKMVVADVRRHAPGIEVSEAWRPGERLDLSTARTLPKAYVHVSVNVVRRPEVCASTSSNRSRPSGQSPMSTVTSQAPSSSATRNRPAGAPTRTTVPAPARVAYIAAAMPTGPRPWTTTVSPTRGGRTQRRPCTTVGPAHPSATGSTADVPSGRRNTAEPGPR